MNRKAQIGINGFLIAFIVALVGLVLFVTVAQTTGTSTTTVTLGPTVSNNTILAADVPDAIDTRIDLIGQDLFGTATVVNATGGQTALAGNYTVGEHVSTTTGVKSVYFELDTVQFSGANLTASGRTGLNITYQYGPDGYINSSGGRAMASLIVLFFAIAIAFVVLSPTLQSKALDAIGR